MEMNNVYEFSFYIPSILYLFPLLFIAVGIGFLISLRKPYVGKRLSRILFGIVFIAVGLFASFMCASQIIYNYTDIVTPYCNGEYSEVEGQVENLETRQFWGNGDDSFSVNGVDFQIGGLQPGYQKQAAYGGKITENGQKVKIKYIESGGFNYIMSLSIAE